MCSWVVCYMVTKILVIEDETSILENLVEVLLLANYEVEAAENGRIGVEKAVDMLPDVIVCDILMPELDGWDVYDYLQKNPDTADIPFIFLTAHADKKSIERGISLGVTDYITKPFTNADLLAAIQNCLGNS